MSVELNLNADSLPPVYVAAYADKGYFQHAVVMCASVERHANPNRPYEIFLFYSDCNDHLLEKARKSFGRFRPNVNVLLIELEEDGLQKLEAKKAYLSGSIYNKIYVFMFLPKYVEKILFLDSDIVVRADVSNLFDMGLKGRLLAAVREKNALLGETGEEELATLGLASWDDYFNSGVMLIDLVRWREEKVSERAFAFCVHSWHKTRLHDQDAYNAVVNGDWLPVDPRWNPRALNLIHVQGGTDVVMSNREIYESQMEFLIHYSGGDKPWSFRSRHPARKWYRKYLKTTEFSDYKYPDVTVKNVLFMFVWVVKENVHRFSSG